MKTLYLTIILFIFATLAFLPNSFAQDTSPEYVVRLIYFIPNDSEPDPDIDIKLDTLIKDAQKFYADQLEAHGFNRKTFRFEADENENAVVHHVIGKFDDAYYRDPSGSDIVTKVWHGEIDDLFDTSRSVFLVAIDINSDYLDENRRAVGLGFGNSQNGAAFILAPDEFNLSVAIHELGHAFGLAHDIDKYRPNAERLYTTGINDWMVSAFCAAHWLNVSRYFNADKKPFNENTVIEMPTLSLANPPQDIRVQFEVSDTDGLHQVQLFLSHIDSVVDYRQLSGNEATIDFVTEHLLEADSIRVRVIDTHGNFTEKYIPIDITDVLPPDLHDAVSIPDPVLTAEIRNVLNLPDSDNITALDMLKLNSLFFASDQITSLTGLEYAFNLETFGMVNQKFSDITPLGKLKKLKSVRFIQTPIDDLKPLVEATQLESITLIQTAVSDISPVGALTQLKHLSLLNNPIREFEPIANFTTLESLSLDGFQDLTPISKLNNLKTLTLSNNFRPSKGTPQPDLALLAQLPQLTALSISRYNISDIAPLSSMVQLKSLRLWNNEISDIKHLASLTQLVQLELGNNNISDITPLADLKQLESLKLSGNQIRDVRPFAKMTNLTSLYLIRNPIVDREPLLTLLRANPEVRIFLKSEFEALPVTLSSFKAVYTSDGVILKWTTESEVDNAGFYIYRSETKDGEFKVVNLSMIQGSGTTGERNNYTWTDITAKPNTVYYYRIEDVSYAGVRQQLATVRLRGLVSASGKLITSWGDVKTQE